VSSAYHAWTPPEISSAFSIDNLSNPARLSFYVLFFSQLCGAGRRRPRSVDEFQEFGRTNA
jgi:hypothetical protein